MNGSGTTTKAYDQKARPALAAWIERDRAWLTDSLFRAVEAARRAGGAAPLAGFDEADRFARANVSTAVDLFARWSHTRDRNVLTLFVGWLNLCANERLNTGRPADFAASPLDETWQSWSAGCAPDLPSQTLETIRVGLSR